MRVIRVVANDFLAYEECDLDLSGVSQVAVMGPVGAGKSSIVEAITWALWGEARGAVLDSVIRDGQDLCTVRVDLVLGDTPVSVTRTKSRGRDSTLMLEVAGEVQTRHVLRETQAEINRLIGLPYPAALAGPLMVQGDTGALMRLRPAERKEVLLGLYGLERFAALEQAAKERRDSATVSARSSQAMLEGLGDLESRLTIAQTALDALTPRIETLTEAVVLGRDRVEELTSRTAGLKERTSRAVALNQELTDARAQFQQASAARKAAQEELTAARARLGSIDVVEIDAALPERIATAEEAAREAAKQHAGRYSALADLKAMLRAAETAQQVTCPDCGKVFRPGVGDDDVAAMIEDLAEAEAVESAAAQAKTRAEAAMRSLRGEEQALMSARSKRAAVETELARLEERIEAGTTLLDELAARGRRAKGELEGLEDVGPELTSALDELATAKDGLASNERALRIAEDEAVRQGAEMERIKRDQERATQLQAEHEAATKDIQTFALLAKAFHRDGIPTLMLESGLPLIEQRANEVLGRMPGDFRVRLVTQRMGAGGKAQDRLDVVVEVAGTEREYEKLSGGQKFRVDLALRLGLTRALSGRQFESLIIDEGLDRFQDAAGREALLESLAAVSTDFGLVLVVSHHPDVIERFENRIEVAMQDGVSVAQLV